MLVVKVAGVTLAEGAISAPGPNSNLPGGVNGLPASAWYGEPMHASIVIDDPNGEYDFDLPWQTMTVDETDCTTKSRIFTGWLTARTISRGPYKHGPGRVWECDIVDQNALFSFEVFRASSAKRPAETDIARVAFAIASAPMAFTPVHDNGRADLTNNPINFGDADYVTQYPVELFASVAGISGKNFYAYWDDTAGEISLYYDLAANFPTSALSISNVMADVDDDEVFYPYRDGQLVRDPQNVYTGELLGYRGAYVYVRRQATIDAIGSSDFSPDEFHRDIVRSTDRIGLEATATAVATADLVRLAEDEEKVTCTVRLPSTHVNLIQAGDQVPAKFTHLPGLDSGFTGMNVIRRNVVPTAGRRDFYDVHLEMKNTGDVARGPGGGDPSELPHNPPDVAEHWYEGSFTGNADGGGLYRAANAQAFVSGEDYNYSITIVPDGPSYAPSLGLTEDNGASTWAASDVALRRNGSYSVAGTFTFFGDNDPIEQAATAGLAGPHDDSTSYVVTFWFDPVGWEGGTVPLPPRTGQRVENEPVSPDPDGATLVFTTRWPYADGTLRVFVDNTNQTGAVVESDPATGEFTLAFAPEADEVIRVYYQGR